jgi:hypothetical protein
MILEVSINLLLVTPETVALVSHRYNWRGCSLQLPAVPGYYFTASAILSSPLDVAGWSVLPNNLKRNQGSLSERLRNTPRKRAGASPGRFDSCSYRSIHPSLSFVFVLASA